MKTKLLTSTILSLSLLTGTVSAEKICTGDYCLIDLSKFSPTKKTEISNRIHVVTSFKSEEIKKVVKIVLDERQMSNQNKMETIVFPHETYVMTKAEIEEYQVENFLMLPLDEIENRIINKTKNKTKLPVSEYFCEDYSKPIYNNLSDTYECA